MLAECGISTQKLQEIQEKGHCLFPKIVSQIPENVWVLKNVSWFPENVSQFPKNVSWFPEKMSSHFFWQPGRRKLVNISGKLGNIFGKLGKTFGKPGT